MKNMKIIFKTTKIKIGKKRSLTTAIVIAEILWRHQIIILNKDNTSG